MSLTTRSVGGHATNLGNMIHNKGAVECDPSDIDLAYNRIASPLQRKLNLTGTLQFLVPEVPGASEVSESVLTRAEIPCAALCVCRVLGRCRGRK